jgi:hypothetical protein
VAAVNGAADPLPSPADTHALPGSANSHGPEGTSTRARCAFHPLPDREPCRYPAKAGTDRCTSHVEYPSRRVDATRWCAAWRPVLNATCQSYVVPGSLFCVEHEGKPSTRMAPPEGEAPPARAAQNGHAASLDRGRNRPASLAAVESPARSTVIAAMGNNPPAILVTIGVLVETGAGPLS